MYNLSEGMGFPAKTVYIVQFYTEYMGETTLLPGFSLFGMKQYFIFSEASALQRLINAVEDFIAAGLGKIDNIAQAVHDGKLCQPGGDGV